MKKQIKICIIGAGPSGLAAAEALRERGYHNVTILERAGRPGGMALSKEYVDPVTKKKIIYELGSLMPVGANFGQFSKLLSRYNLHLGKGENPDAIIKGAIYSLNQRKYIIDYKATKIGYPYTKFFHAFFDLNKVRYYLHKYRQLSEPGFINVTDEQLEELSQPYEDWLNSKNFLIITPETKYVMGSILDYCNPTYKNKMSAIYMLKLMMQFAKKPIRYLNGEFQFLREGYQELWNRIAKQHDVRYGENIKHIIRDNNGITVETEKEKLFFDKIIISCSPDKAKKILTVSPEEKAIFDKIIYCPGIRAVFKAKGMVHDGVYALLEPYYDNKLFPCILSFFPEGQIDKDTWLYGATFSGENLKDMDTALITSKKILQEHFNASDIEWIDKSIWYEYNPHFNCEDVKNKIYNRYESLQGKNQTYFTGGAIAGGTNPIVIEYSYNLVDRMISDTI